MLWLAAGSRQHLISQGSLCLSLLLVVSEREASEEHSLTSPPVFCCYCCHHCLLAQKVNVMYHKDPKNKCLQFCLHPLLNQLHLVLPALLSLYLFVWVLWSQGLQCLVLCTLLLESSKIKLCNERLQDQPICSSKLLPEAIACKTNPS